MPFLDPDEGLYATIAQEMLTGGDWVIPHINGLPYLEKPPLFFSLTGLTLWLVGPSEWATRLWSALPALGTVILTWRIGRRLYGARAGLLAGLVLATVVGNALYVRKASTDELFVFCITLAMYGFLRDAERPDRGRARFLLFYLGAALGVLAKGFTGVVFPLLIVGLGMAVARRLSWRDLNLVRGAALFAVVALPWHVLVAWRSPTLFAFYVVDNHLLRFLDARGYVEDDVPSSTLAFLVASFLWAFPWSVFTLARPGPDASPHARWRPVIVIWLLVVVGLFALSRFKHEYYALPAFPALAVLVGGAWASGRDIRRWLVIGLTGCSAVGLGALWARGRADTRAGAQWPGRAERLLSHLARPGDPLPVRVAPSVRRAVEGAGAGPARGLGVGGVLLGARLAPQRVHLARWFIRRDHRADFQAPRRGRAPSLGEGNRAGDQRAGRPGRRARRRGVARVQPGTALLHGPPCPHGERRPRLLVVRRDAARGARSVHRHGRPDPPVGWTSARVPGGASPARPERRGGAPSSPRPRARALRLALALLEPVAHQGCCDRVSTFHYCDRPSS